MATIYKIDIETVSEWINYNPDEIKKKLIDFLKDENNFNMKNVKINIIRKA